MSLISQFRTGTYTVRRKSKGTYVEGFYHPGADEIIQVQGSLQPTNARELKLPEEGARLKQYWVFYTDQPILTVSPADRKGADEVEVNGELYKVMSVETWKGEKIRLGHHLSILYRESFQ